MNNHRIKLLILYVIHHCLILLLIIFGSKCVLSKEKISATKFLGITSGHISITLSNRTVLKLDVSPTTLKEDVNIILSEPDIVSYQEDIIGVFSVEIKNGGDFRLRKYLHIKVCPVIGIDINRKEMIQVYKLKEQEGDRKYWSRVFSFHIDRVNESIDILIKEPGIYKIQYTKLKVSVNKNEAFFRLNSPNHHENDANFSLRFNDTGYIYFLIENENEENIWNGYSDLQFVREGWEYFTISATHFNNKSAGKYRVSCYNQLDVIHSNELWTAWFIRDHESLGSEATVKALLNKFAPYVHYGNYTVSKDSSSNPWEYQFEREMYYPIDIRELVTTYAPNLTTNDGVSGYRVTVGIKSYMFTEKDTIEHYISNAKIITTTDSEGIDLASYNDASFEYGITRNWSFNSSQYELLEFEGSNDAPYISEVNLIKFGSIDNDDKIYGTAYKQNGYIFLQYFFYYPFDPKNNEKWKSEYFSRHAGDRERFVIILKKANNIEESQPVGAYFFHHLDNQKFSYYYGDDLNDDQKKFSWNDKKEETPGAYVKWIKVNKTGDHPHIYVAQGSHGIYFRQGSYTVDYPYKKALKEYAGGQSEKTYSTEDGNLIYLPRLSGIDTEKNNTEFSFLLFSGTVAQTSGLLDTKIYFPPYDDVWYAVDKYCFNENGEFKPFKPRNDVSDKLSDVEDSITHRLTVPSKTTVSQGGILGPISIEESNNSSSYYAFYIQPYVTKPDGITVNFKQVSTGLKAGETRTLKGYLYIPASSELGTFTFGVKITDTSGNLIDDDSFEFTVVSSSSSSSINKKTARRLKRLMRKPDIQVQEEGGWNTVIVPE